MARRKNKRRPGWRKPELTVAQILAWADAFHERTGLWPKARRAQGYIVGSLGEKWLAISGALRQGHRGLPGGSSLALLLAEHRGVRYRNGPPRLTVKQILAWADSFHDRTGKWPSNGSREIIAGSNGESWLMVSNALRGGRRGLPGGSSLARLLAEHRGVRNRKNLPRLTAARILAWADAFHKRTGRWPGVRNWYETIPGSSGETWLNVEQALSKGLRGLPGGSSLARLLAEGRGMRNPARPPRLTIAEIHKWAVAYRKRTGQWPRCRSSPQMIEGSCGETWYNVDQAMRKGLRGLSGGSSLARLHGCGRL